MLMNASLNMALFPNFTAGIEDKDDIAMKGGDFYAGNPINTRNFAQ